MKKFALIISLILCVCSCTIKSNVYRVKTVYRIDDGEPKTEIVDFIVRPNHFPVYCCKKHPSRYELYIASENATTQYQTGYYLIYKGSFKVVVDSFDYELIQTGKYSFLTGRMSCSVD